MFLSVDILFLYLLIFSYSPEIYAHKQTPPKKPTTNNPQPTTLFLSIDILFYPQPPDMRKTVTILTAILWMMMMPAISSAMNIADASLVRSISMNSGLPSNAVRSIVQGKNGYIWFGTDNGLCRYDGYTVQTFYNNKVLDQFISTLAACDEGLLLGTMSGAYFFSFQTEQFTLIDKSINSHVAHLSIDANHNVWISTSQKGIFCYNLSSHECRNYPMKQCSGNVNCTLIDANNQVWALSGRPSKARQALMRLNKSSNQFEPFKLKDPNLPIGGMAMAANPDGSILIGTWEDGLYQVNVDGSAKLLVSASLSNAMHHIHNLHSVSGSQVLVGSDDGLVEYDFQKNSWRILSEKSASSSNPLDRFIYSIASDREGGLWVGTFYSGVRYIPSAAFDNRFKAYFGDNEGDFKGNVVGRFVEDALHRIWIATDDAGLDCYDPVSGKFVNFPGKAAMRKYNVHALLAEGSTLWLGTYGSDIIRMDMTTGATKTYRLENAPAGSSCYCLFRDSRHRLWATSMNKAFIFNEGKNAFDMVKTLNSLTIDIDEDRQGNVWFGTQGNGLWRYGANKAWKQFMHGDGGSATMPGSQINCLHFNGKDRMYIATNVGLYTYNVATGKFSKADVNAPSQDFTSIIEVQGELWLSSSKGIVRYVPGEPVQVFNRYDGLTCDQFLPNSGLLASDGRIYFGTTQGFNAFYPYQVKVNHVAPPVAITSLELFNKHVEVGSDKLPESLGLIKQLELSYSDNVINISFAALSYVSPEKNQYAYMLEGFDKDWTTTHEHRATYTNLPYGTYTFRVKAANNDGVWSKEDAQLRIRIHPPFWWSLPAKALYLLIIIGLVWLYTHIRVKREKRRHQLELDALEEKQQQEVRDARLQFFTMIAHEIRTPVSLIIGPLENLKGEWAKLSGTTKDSRAMNATIDVIDRNAQRLLNLVNQLLDFNKVQQSGMQVHFKLQNISRLISAVVERFEPTLRKNGTTLEVKYPKDDFAAVIDTECITKVVSNLMTNANKYTKDYVCLSCEIADSEHFRIIVTDNGDGIDSDEQKKIFSAFYQAKDNKPGTGIGLNIVKNLVEAHHGKVEVRSEVGKGATFIVTLPIHQQDAAVGEEAESELTHQVLDAENHETERNEENALAAGNEAKSSKAAMLIVEDDDDMRQFIASNFAETYQVFTAENGVKGMELLRIHPSITMIVSDWMMPEMDGDELCRRIRKDPSTSHIPFIMLTAKTDDGSKTEGMNCGADAYIEKPFSMKYLEACIRNMLEMRKLLQSKYSHMPLEPITEIGSNEVDNDFLLKMKQLIEDNLTNPSLSVVFLAEQMNISRSSLFAKIKALVDVTPNEMIQLVKLKKAATLLKSGKYRINEVCYMVGFSSPSYFSKCFQKQFGMKPGEFIDQE